MRRVILLLILLGGCEAIDPFQRQGAWRPMGANEANLRTHVADPAMLERGVDDPRADGAVIAAAIRRYRTDRVKPLPAMDVSRVQATGQAGAAPPAAAGGADGGR